MNRKEATFPTPTPTLSPLIGEYTGGLAASGADTKKGKESERAHSHPHLQTNKYQQILQQSNSRFSNLSPNIVCPLTKVFTSHPTGPSLPLTQQ